MQTVQVFGNRGASYFTSLRVSFLIHRMGMKALFLRWIRGVHKVYVYEGCSVTRAVADEWKQTAVMGEIVAVAASLTL